MPSDKKNRWCFVPMCKNTDKSTPGKVFLCVPANKNKRKQWWRAARRKFPVLECSLYCCEDHFNLKEDMENYLRYTMVGGYIKLKAGVLPHKFDCQGRSTPVNANRAALQRKRLIQEILAEKENNHSVPAADACSPMDGVREAHDGHPGGDSDEPSGHLGSLEEPSPKNTGLQNVQTTTRRSKAVQMTWMQADAACNTDVEQLKDASTDNTGLSDEDLVSSFDSSDMDHDRSKEYVPIESISSSEDDATARTISLNRTRKMIMKNPMGYIGVQRDHLYILDLLCDHVSYHNREQIISAFDEILLVLMVIRTGIANYIIADMFGVSKSCVSRILARVVPVMAGWLEELVYWPSSDIIRSRLPQSFKVHYHMVESIIDFFEIQIEKSSSALTQSMTWSEYKKCSSVKYLISVTPAGLINFISCGRPGRCSDVEMLRGSGYLDCLSPGMTVLAGQGFEEVEGDLAAKGCHLAHPASVGKDGKVSAKEVRHMKVIAGLYIHVEKVISRVRAFKMLDVHSCTTISVMDQLDDIVKMVCGLVNLQEPIIRV